MNGKLLVLTFICVLAASPVRGDEPPAAPIWIVPEHPAILPTTSREDVDGREVILGPDGGKVTILHFWATWCAPCIAELPTIAGLAAELASRGVVVFAVSEDRGGASDVQPFLHRRPVPAPTVVVLDSHRSLAKSLGVGALPMTIVFDAEGREQGRLIGTGDWGGSDRQRLLSEIGRKAIPDTRPKAAP